MLRFDDVSYTGENTPPLIDVSFTLNAGETFVFFGPENSGLSLICPLAAGILTEYEGNILYRNNALRSFDYIALHNYRKEIGYLQRFYGLINNMSVEENISLPLKYHSTLSFREITEKVETMLSELNLTHCRNIRPVDLLRSEILKTAYARAIALDPSMILLEHALEGQCLINVQTYLESLRKKAIDHNTSILITTFEPMRYLDYADKFIMLYNGNIVFEGTSEQFAATENPFVVQYKNSSSHGPMRIL
jgi:ABC-type transporter Mla maintaining outer membrane lipid asymmetry ATPase subunit MlaF